MSLLYRLQSIQTQWNTRNKTKTRRLLAGVVALGSILIIGIRKYRQKQAIENKIQYDELDLNEMKEEETFINDAFKMHMIDPTDYKKPGMLNIPISFAKKFVYDSASSPFISPSKSLHKKIQNILIMYNPISGKAAVKRLVNKHIIPFLQSKQYKSDGIKIKKIVETKFEDTKCCQYLIKNKNEIVNNLKIDTMFVIGGGGTILQFINGYMFGGYSYDKDHITAILLDTGTSGTISKCLQLDREHDPYYTKYLKKIFMDQTKLKIQMIDVMELEMFNQDNVKTRFYTSLICGFGLAGKFVTDSEALRKYFGAYRLLPTMFYFLFASKPSYKVRISMYMDDDHVISFDRSIRHIFATKMYGAKDMAFTPFAKLDNGMVDIMVFPSKYVKFGFNGIVPSNIYQAICQKAMYFRCNKFKVETFKGSNCTDFVMTLGDTIGSAPITAKIIPQAIPVIYVV